MLRKRHNNHKGQAAIEFMVIMVVIFFFLFFFLSLAIVLVVSDYVEYANFMAARTYKSGGTSETYQFRNAQTVFSAYTDRIQGIAKNFTLQRSIIDPNVQQTAGLVSTYDINLFYFPPIFLLENIPPAKVKLKTEAYLGRDPAADECSGFFSKFAQKYLGIDSNYYVEQMEDNGC
jgi:Flp pilus assembly protein TadG